VLSTRDQGLRRRRAGLEIPIEDLPAVPEQHVALLADRLEDTTKVLRPMRRPHDIGMHRDRHHAGGALGIGVDLFEPCLSGWLPLMCRVGPVTSVEILVRRS
jgi:hypothetical protein